MEDAFQGVPQTARPPEPEFQVDWHGHRVDALYRDHNLIIELDGHRDHGQWDRIERDHVRDALAIEYHHDTLRITWRRLHKEADELERQLRAILAAREPPQDAAYTPAGAGAATSASGSVSATSAGIVRRLSSQ